MDNPWAEALPLIMAEGVGESTARKFIGRMVSRYGKDRAMRAIRRAQEVQPVDVRGFIIGWMEHDARTASWKVNNEAALLKARELGIEPGIGESWASLRARIRNADRRAA